MQATSEAAPVPGLVRVGRFFFKFRDLLFPLVFLPLALLTPPTVLLGHPLADIVVGTAIVVLGQGLRALVIGLAYIRRGGKNRQIHADDLVQTGIFAHSRNPLYLGNLLIIAGLVLLHGGPWMCFLVLPFFVFVYVAIVAAEERYLGEHFGPAYAAYCRRVPRFVPRPRGLLATIRGMQFDGQRLLRKEYGTFFSTITAVLLLIAFEYLYRHGLHASRAFLQRLAIVWFPFILAYLTARVLKKRGALGSG